MEKKLELADIAMHLPYGLKVLYYGASEDDDTQWEVRGLHHNYGVETLTGDGYVWCLPIDKCKPILRPMSDLTKPMTHPDVNGGEEFVPMIEIFNLFIKPYIETFSGVVTVQRLAVSTSNDPYFKNSIYIKINGEDGCSLLWNDERKCFRYFNLYYNFDKPLFYIINVFQFLSKLHFDYNDLIGQGLAIDINTLNKG